MNRPADPMREIAALRERLSRLSEASLHITEDLDLDAVLQGVLDGARSLTGARMGGVTILDDSGQLQDFITSGLTDEDHQRFVNLPGGPEFFAYLSSLPEPLRLADFSAHTTALGLPEIGPPLGPVGSFLGAPIRLRGVRAGNLYLSDKEGGGEFTQDDEETLAMFASHAAMAIANARRHREEQRARAYLETLIDTTPVGVVVFNAGTGVPVSLNREGRRLVDGLRNPGQTAEQLLDVLTFRRADGREFSLREFPLAEALSTGETVRAEEIVISVPDGRSVSVLLNATAIRSEEGQVESVVVTLQDMTALEELDRLRAEFLGMVSHELRAPLTSIKGSAATVLGSTADLDPAVVRQFFRIIDEQADHMHDLVADLLDVARIETGTLPVTPEPAEVAVLVDRARSTFTSAGGRNNLAIDIDPDLPLVMADRRRIVQVVGNLLSNAAKHSSESAVIRISAVREDVHVAVAVADEGRGISSERLPYLFRKFTRTDGDDLGSGVAGSGLGLAICKGIVEAHGGRIWAESEGLGMGARFTFSIPTVEMSGSGAASGPSPLSTRSSRRAVAGAGERARVLAVDDDPQALRYVRDALASAGYTPVVTGGPGGGAPTRGGGEARSGPARPDAAGDRRHRADEGHPASGRRAGHLRVRLRPGRAHRQGLRHGGRRLRRQALLAYGAGGADQSGVAQAGGVRAVRALRAGRSDNRLCRTERDACRSSALVDRDGVPAARRAFGQCRAAVDLRASAGTGLGREEQQRRRAAHAHHRKQAPPQAGR